MSTKKIHSVSLDANEVLEFQKGNNGSLSSFFNNLLVKFNKGSDSEVETKEALKQINNKADELIIAINKQIEFNESIVQNSLDASQRQSSKN